MKKFALLAVLLAAPFAPACADATIIVEAPDALPSVQQPAPVKAPWYAHAALSRPACVKLKAPTLAACTAAFLSADGAGLASTCTTNPQTGDVSCSSGLFVQRELAGFTAFDGDDFVAEFTPGYALDVYGARFENGREGACTLTSFSPTLCVYAQPERN